LNVKSPLRRDNAKDVVVALDLDRCASPDRSQGDVAEQLVLLLVLVIAEPFGSKDKVAFLPGMPPFAFLEKVALLDGELFPDLTLPIQLCERLRQERLTSSKGKPALCSESSSESASEIDGKASLSVLDGDCAGEHKSSVRQA
jgi:hypothetical protein